MLADEKILFRKIFKRALLPSFTSIYYQIFVTMATRVDLSHFALAQLNRPTPKTPTWCKNLGDISYTS